MMKRLKALVPILVGVGFAMALLAGVRWSAEPMFNPPQGLSSGSDANLVKARYPHRLIDPSELKAADDEVFWAWTKAEIQARLKVVTISLGVFAAFAVTLAYYWGKKNFYCQNKGKEENTWHHQ